MKVLRLPARASAWYIATNISAKAVGMLLTPLFTRILSGAEYGEYALYMSWLGLGATVATGVVSQNVIYKGFVKYEGRENEFLLSVIGAAGACALVIGGAIGGIGVLMGLPVGLLPVFLLQLLADTVICISAAGARYRYRYKSIALSVAIQSIGAPMISVLLMYFFGAGGEARIYGLLIPAVAVAAVALAIALRRGRRLYDGEAWRFALGRSVGLLPYLVSGAVIAQADKLLVSRIHGEVALARYSVAHTVGMGLAFAVGGISSSLSPWIIRKLRGGKAAEVRETVAILAKGIAAAATFIVAIAPEAMAFLAPVEYGEAAVAVMPVAVAALPSFLVSVCAVVATYAERGGGVSPAAVAGAAVGILSGVLLIPEFRYTGAAFSLFLAHTVMAVCAYFALRRQGIGEVLELGRIGRYFALSVGWSGVIAQAYSSFSLRTLLLIPPALALTGAAFDVRERIVEVGG